LGWIRKHRTRNPGSCILGMNHFQKKFGIKTYLFYSNNIINRLYFLLINIASKSKDVLIFLFLFQPIFRQKCINTFLTK